MLKNIVKYNNRNNDIVKISIETIDFDLVLTGWLYPPWLY